MKQHFALVSYLSNGELWEHKGRWDNYPSDGLIEMEIRNVRGQLGPDISILHTEVKKRYVDDSDYTSFVLALVPIKAGETHEEALANTGDGRSYIVADRIKVKNNASYSEQIKELEIDLKFGLKQICRMIPDKIAE